MKKIVQLIRNVYWIRLVKPDGKKKYSHGDGTINNPQEMLMADSLLRPIIADDVLPFEADPQIREILCRRVGNNGHQNVQAKNSLFEIFLPLFSSRHIEIKMAVISLALFLMVGLGPKNNQASNKNLHLLFLADTLADTSAVNLPAVQDTAFRVQYK